MKAKARSLSAHQDRKSKVALNFIIRAVLYKGRVFICGILLSQREEDAFQFRMKRRNKFNAWSQNVH